MTLTTKSLGVQIQKGWKPHNYLTNMCQAYFADPEDFVATKIFPLCPVQQSISRYYTFSKADLARDNVQPKPSFGKVTPALMGHSDDTYRCEVDQVIVGIDEITALDYTRAGASGAMDPRRAKARFIAEQMLIHLDVEFAKKYFGTGVWGNEWTGVTSAPTGKQFYKFNDANFDPVNFFDTLMKEVKQGARRRPNKLVLGAEAYIGLKNNPELLERVKYTGSTVNPANVTTNVIAQLFRLDAVEVLEGTYNAAGIGDEDMQFICNPKGALLCYTTDVPAIDEPSAGYIFTWDMMGDGNYMAVDQWPGEGGTHSEFIEGLMSTDMKKTSDDLAVYLHDCV